MSSLVVLYMEVSQKLVAGPILGAATRPYNQDHGISGSVFGARDF